MLIRLVDITNNKFDIRQYLAVNEEGKICVKYENLYDVVIDTDNFKFSNIEEEKTIK